MALSERMPLIRQIELEHQACTLALSGITSGTLRHDFIQARMSKIEELRLALEKEVGYEEAMKLLVNVLEGMTNEK